MKELEVKFGRKAKIGEYEMATFEVNAKVSVVNEEHGLQELHRLFRLLEKEIDNEIQNFREPAKIVPPSGEHLTGPAKAKPVAPVTPAIPAPTTPVPKKKDWRTDPASLAQKEKLQKLGITANIDTLTKGQADVLIKNISGGAK